MMFLRCLFLVVAASLPLADAVTLDWGFGNSQAETVAVNETVTLQWTGEHNVYQFPDQDSFTSCDFTSATEICAQSISGSCDLPDMDEGETYYYGCQVPSHCGAGQKVAITPEDSESGGGGGGDGDSCFLGICC